MAGILAVAQTGELATGGGSVQKTLLQVVAAANHRVLVKEISISFTGQSSTAKPIEVEVARQSDAGTSSALTPEKLNESDQETLQTTARENASVEPTTGNTIQSEVVHPQSGYTWQAPFGAAIVIQGGDRLGLMVTAAADVNAVCRMVFEE